VIGRFCARPSAGKASANSTLRNQRTRHVAEGAVMLAPMIVIAL
jgi:hypothetical protein